MTRHLRGFGFLALANPVAFRSPQDPPRIVHVYVALAANEHQGIIPVPAVIGNGSDPARNMYWGAAFGIKTFSKKTDDWEMEWCGHGPKGAILERCIFKNRKDSVYMVADAYQRSQIRVAVSDFLSAAAGANAGIALVKKHNGELAIPSGGRSDVVAQVGHDAFMDFQMTPIAGKKGRKAQGDYFGLCE
jgi:hypothetical protein